MNITFKNIARVFFVSALSVAALSSCSKWTETESVKYEYLTLEQKNPELYEAYMESLHEYRSSQHQVMIAKFDNSAETPDGKAKHINSLPDSVDMVILKNPSEISNYILADVKELQEKRHTEVLAEISIDRIYSDYKAYEEKWLLAHAPKPENPEEPEVAQETAGDETAPAEQMLTYAQFIAEQMPELLKPLDEYPYDGLNLIFRGKNPLSLTEETKAIQLEQQEALFTPVMKWLDAHQEATFLFQGRPQNILIEGIVPEIDLILVDCEKSMIINDFDHQVRQIILEGGSVVPTDKFVPVVSTKNVMDPKIFDGYFTQTHADGSEMTAIEGAALFAASSHAGYDICGIAVNHSQYDYYNPTRIYPEISLAISIMNPSPLK